MVNAARPQLRIDYQTYPSDTSPYLKLVRALETSTAPYSVVCADDDFIVSGSMQRCVQFLESNKDYAVAHGNSTMVEVVAGPDSKLASALSAFDYPLPTIDSESPLQRLVDHLELYTPTYYSVHRRQQLANALQQAFENTVDYRFGELLTSCLSVIHGKAARLDILFLVRQGEPAAATVKYGDQMLPWTELAQREDFSSRYSDFENCLIRELGTSAGISAIQAKPAIHRAFLWYLKRAADEEAIVNCQGQSRGTGLGDVALRVRRLVSSVPAVMQEVIDSKQPTDLVRSPRKFYQKVLARRDSMSLESLTDSRSAFRDDFQPIYQLLVKYPNGMEVQNAR